MIDIKDLRQQIDTQLRNLEYMERNNDECTDDALNKHIAELDTLKKRVDTAVRELGETLDDIERQGKWIKSVFGIDMAESFCHDTVVASTDTLDGLRALQLLVKG